MLTQSSFHPKSAWTLVTLFLAAVLIGTLPAVRSADDGLNDLIMSSMSTVTSVRDDIAIVAITEETLQAFPYRSPINRSFLADLVEQIDQHRPAAIGMDLVLDTRSDPQSDGALRDALTGLQSAWTGVRAHVTGDRAQIETSLLGERAGASPYLVADGHDGVVRRIGLQDDISRPFAAALASLTEKNASPNQKPFRVFRGQDGQWPFRVVPAHRLTDIPAESGWLEGRTVLIGAIIDNTDRHPTSLRFASQNSRLPGVIIHAYQVAHLLDGAPRTRAPLWLNGVICLAMLAGGAFIGWRAGQVWIWGVPGLLLLLSPLMISAGLYSSLGWTSVITIPMLTGLFAMIAFSVRRRMALANSLAYVTEAFGRYMDDGLVRQLVQDQTRSFAKPKQGEAVFLFTDINGFTKFVESHSPETLKAVLDRYIDLVASTIQSHHGVIDRFVGDGVHAIFGMPIEDDSARQKALACALDLAERTAALQADLKSQGVELGATRMALHAGTALFGDFGGAKRADFTAHGNAINITARLVDFARDQNAVICASERLFEATAPPPGWHRFDNIDIRGSNHPLTVYCRHRH